MVDLYVFRFWASEGVLGRFFAWTPVSCQNTGFYRVEEVTKWRGAVMTLGYVMGVERSIPEHVWLLGQAGLPGTWLGTTCM